MRSRQTLRVVAGAGDTVEPNRPATAPIAAKVVDAVKLYGRGDTSVKALDGVDLEIEQGRFTAIMGPSGSGKSTLLHCLAGLDTLTHGHAYIGDIELGSLDDRRLTKLRRDRVGFVFQAFNLLPALTASENITLPLALGGRRADPVWFDRVVDAVGLRNRLGHRPAELSGGQQQRVAAARALITQPEIIFADEPTGNLDSKAGGELLAFMRRAVDEFGQTIVMVTHDHAAASAADRIVRFADGQVVHDDMQVRTVERQVDHINLIAG